MQRTSFIAWVAAFLAGCVRRSRSAVAQETAQSKMMNGSMMNGGMMNVSQHDMSVYMEMFTKHAEIRRDVERLPMGYCTVTESDDPHLVMLLQEHVPSMWAHVNDGDEVRCMSDSLPTMFRNSAKYQRKLELTPKGVQVVETTGDAVVLAALRRHADEVSGFVREGMPAMMRGMMQ